MRRLLPQLQVLDEVPAEHTQPTSARLGADWLLVKEAIKASGLHGLGTQRRCRRDLNPPSPPPGGEPVCTPPPPPPARPRTEPSTQCSLARTPGASHAQLPCRPSAAQKWGHLISQPQSTEMGCGPCLPAQPPKTNWNGPGPAASHVVGLWSSFPAGPAPGRPFWRLSPEQPRGPGLGPCALLGPRAPLAAGWLPEDPGPEEDASSLTHGNALPGPSHPAPPAHPRLPATASS